jgi:hypothetical protein
MKHKFVLKRDDDENLTVLLNGTEVGSANHDEDGWGGMESMETLVKAIAAVLKIPVEEE